MQAMCPKGAEEGKACPARRDHGKQGGMDAGLWGTNGIVKGFKGLVLKVLKGWVSVPGQGYG